MSKARRRTKGYGSVFEAPKGSGSWWARMPADGPGTPTKWRVASKAEGETLLKQKLRERDDGLKITGRGRTIQQCVAHYITDVFTGKENIRENYGLIAKTRIYPHLGKVREDKLTSPQVRTWVKDLSETYARNSVQNTFRLLRAALKVAVNDQLIRRNPTDGVTLPHAPHTDGVSNEAYAMTHAEAAQLLAAVEDHRLYTLYYVAIVTGMRQGELIGLRDANVILDGPEPKIRVVEQIQLVKNQPVFQTVKTKKGHRDIPIDATTVAVLRAYRVQLLEAHLKNGAAWNADKLFFPSLSGTPLRARNLYRHFKAVLKAASFAPPLVERIHFHHLRHTAGSLMLAEGVRIQDVSEILGHSSTEVTARIYAHAYKENKRQAVATIVQNLRRAGGKDA